jgi:cold shock CspA family protein
MLIGLVKWFDVDKGFGVVKTPSGEEYFLHINSFTSKPEKILKGTPIAFSPKTDKAKTKNSADNSRLVGITIDWKTILSYLGKSDSVQIEIEVTGRSRFGNQYHRKEIQSFSLVGLSLKYFFKDKNEEEVSNFIIDYFDNDLDPKLFILYCELIEDKIPKHFSSDIASIILKTVFSHFGKNLNEDILFYTWKTQKYKYISYTDAKEFNIPEKVLQKFHNQIGVSELKRIAHYEFGSNFCNHFVKKKFSELKKLTSEEIKALYPFLEFTIEPEQKENKLQLDKLYSENKLFEIIEQANKLQPIKNDNDFYSYNRLKPLVSDYISEEEKTNINEAINKIIVEKCSEEYKPELWIKGIINTAPFEFIIKTFLQAETQNEKRIIILSKLDSAQQLELLKTFVLNNDWEKSFKILEDFIIKENSLKDNVELIEIRNQILSKFSFKIYNSIDRVKAILPSSSLYDELRNKLRQNLYLERKEVDIDKLIKIFTDLKAYKVIKDENHLLEFLADRIVNYSEMTNIILLLSNSCKITLFRAIALHNSNQFSSWQRIKLLESSEQKQELAKVLIDEYFSSLTDDRSSELQSLIDFLKKSKSEVLTKYFLDKFYKELCLKYPILVFELALFSNHINAQKLSYQHLTFNSEQEIVNLIDKVNTYSISDEVKLTNKPLTGFIEFLNATSNLTLTEDCKKFLQVNNGIVQCLSVKYLIFQLHKKVITKIKLIEILNSYQWTEISAMLVKAFIEESNYTEKILLDKLNVIFKSHFEILSSQKFQLKSFLDNFTIRNILNRCDGRKYYNGELWQGKRWYVSGGVSMHTKEQLNCYCEGRPWKKEIFWDSQTNTPLKEQYEKYWCKTSYCAARNDSVDLNQDYRKWTLSEISATLNISIENIALATLAGWANRMNQIVEHLFCRKCKEVLRPLPFRPGTLGYYAVPLFHCINDNCTEKQTIRFTHCLNGKCESHKTSDPLDSRDCKSCRPNDPNHTGLQCNYCGSSCPACSGHNQRIVAQEVW